VSRTIHTEALTAAAFRPFGDVIEASGLPDRMINRGFCGRYDDRARLDFGTGRAGISLFDARIRKLPHVLDLVERHPEGSQAFISMTGHPFLVVVAPVENDRPGTPRAFVTAPGQGVNYHAGTWHGVLAPLRAPGLFAVVDRIGDGANLEEHHFAEPWRIE